MTQVIAICWDVDGTLVDTEPLHKDKIIAVAAAHGIALDESVYWNTLQGNSEKVEWEWLVRERGLNIPLQQFRQECEEYFLSHPEKIAPRAGAKAAFEYFESIGLPQCAISSGAPLQVDVDMGVSGVGTHMLFVLNAADATNPKPDPELYLKGKANLCERFGWDAGALDNKQFIAIEDSLNGVKAAHRAGMTTIFWASEAGKTSPDADYTVYSAEELLAVCKKLTSRNIPPRSGPAASPQTPTRP